MRRLLLLTQSRRLWEMERSCEGAVPLDGCRRYQYCDDRLPLRRASAAVQDTATDIEILRHTLSGLVRGSRGDVHSNICGRNRPHWFPERCLLQHWPCCFRAKHSQYPSCTTIL